MTTKSGKAPSLREKTTWGKALKRDWHLYLMLLLPVALVIIYNYSAYPGLRMVFMDYKPAKGYSGSKWVGWETFTKVFRDKDFIRALTNSIIFNLLDLLVSFPVPIVLALMLNELRFPRFKKVTQTVLYLPHFLSWVIIGSVAYQLFKPSTGIINVLLMKWGWITSPIPFWTNPMLARITIIVVNVWIGIPYMMLIATGLLMNIPEELYESARIDGATPFQMFRSITLPYMLFVTGPFLLTQFTGNLNNFNVIYLLTKGQPQSMRLTDNAGQTDLLVTWLYKMTVTDTNYKMAAVIGIMVFLVTAVVSLVVYNMLPSVKDEGGFQ